LTPCYIVRYHSKIKFNKTINKKEAKGKIEARTIVNCDFLKMRASCPSADKNEGKEPLKLPNKEYNIKADNTDTRQ